MVISTQDGIKLAVHIIDTQFGHLVSKVCECLLLKESATFNQIVKHTGLPRPDVKKCLLVLIQHNCIQPFNMEQRGGFNEQNSVSVQYTPVFSNIIHRIRFPKFLHLVTEKFGEECAEVLQGFLEHGRVTLEQITERAESSEPKAKNDPHDSFTRLVGARFVEQCPDSDPFIELPTDEEDAVRSRRSKFSKVIPQTIEQHAVASAIPMEAKRFLISHHTPSGDTTTTEKDDGSFVPSGEKRKRDSSETDDKLDASLFQKEVLWRPNFEEFVRCLRHKACIVHEKSRLDEGAGVVLDAMLEGCRNPEGTVVSTYSVPLSLNAIYEEVMKTESGRTMTLDHVRSSLDELGCIKDADNLFRVDLSSIIQLCRNEEVESFVLNRYGNDAYMIVRSLSKGSRPCETAKISLDILKDKGETLKILFQMWQDNLLSMEKFSTAAPKSMHFLLWKTNKDILQKQILDAMYHAALNLMSRVSFEFNKESELMLPGSNNKRETRLFSILMKLDDAIMLFQEF